MPAPPALSTAQVRPKVTRGSTTCSPPAARCRSPASKCPIRASTASIRRITTRWSRNSRCSRTSAPLMRTHTQFERRVVVVTAACAVALLAVTMRPTRASSSLPRPDHVVIVIEENHSFQEIYNSASAPYINSLVPEGALFTQSYALEHPSQPNYLDLFSGSNQGVTDDGCPYSLS